MVNHNFPMVDFWKARPPSVVPILSTFSGVRLFFPKTINSCDEDKRIANLFSHIYVNASVLKIYNYVNVITLNAHI